MPFGFNPIFFAVSSRFENENVHTLVSSTPAGAGKFFILRKS